MHEKNSIPILHVHCAPLIATERKKIKVNIVGLLGGNVNNFAKRHEAKSPHQDKSFSFCLQFFLQRCRDKGRAPHFASPSSAVCSWWLAKKRAKHWSQRQPLESHSVSSHGEFPHKSRTENTQMSEMLCRSMQHWASQNIFSLLSWKLPPVIYDRVHFVNFCRLLSILRTFSHRKSAQVKFVCTNLQLIFKLSLLRHRHRHGFDLLNLFPCLALVDEVLG